VAKEVNIPALLLEANRTLLAQGGVFPIGGIRSRAIELTQYCIADGSNPEYGFMHATLKIGTGRSPQVKAKVCEELFALMKQHLHAGARPVALSMELYEFDEDGTFRHNPLHAHFRKAETVAK
jgi:5-carboxymethyl-2-hydroxymuconate isomerase